MATNDLDLLTEKVMISLNGGDPIPDDFRFDFRVVKSMIGNIADFVIKKDIERKKQYNDATFGLFDNNLIVTFKNIKVQLDTDVNQYYALLPEKPSTTVGNKAIHLVSAMLDQLNAFVPVDNSSYTLFNKSQASRLEGRIPYYFDDTKLYFDYDMSGIEKILVKMFVSGSGDSVKIPADLHYPIIQEAMKLLAPSMRVIPDKVNDNTNTR